jgi:hypothetical protein
MFAKQESPRLIGSWGLILLTMRTGEQRFKAQIETGAGSEWLTERAVR